MSLKQNNVNNILMKISSKYVLKNIFDNINFKIFLKIIKYNNKLKKKLNITINDYKNYWEIQILLIPEENSKGIFININKLEKKNVIYILMMIKMNLIYIKLQTQEILIK